MVWCAACAADCTSRTETDTEDEDDSMVPDVPVLQAPEPEAPSPAVDSEPSGPAAMLIAMFDVPRQLADFALAKYVFVCVCVCVCAYRYVHVCVCVSPSECVLLSSFLCY